MAVSGAKVAAKIFMGIDMGISFMAAAMTHTSAVNNQLWALITIGVAALATIIGGAGYQKEDDTLGALIAGAIIALVGAGAIISALGAGSTTLIAWIIFMVGAIVFLCY